MKSATILFLAILVLVSCTTNDTMTRTGPVLPPLGQQDRVLEFDEAPGFDYTEVGVVETEVSHSAAIGYTFLAGPAPKKPKESATLCGIEKLLGLAKKMGANGVIVSPTQTKHRRVKRTEEKFDEEGKHLGTTHKMVMEPYYIVTGKAISF